MKKNSDEHRPNLFDHIEHVLEYGLEVIVCRLPPREQTPPGSSAIDPTPTVPIVKADPAVVKEK